MQDWRKNLRAWIDRAEPGATWQGLFWDEEGNFYHDDEIAEIVETVHYFDDVRMNYDDLQDYDWQTNRDYLPENYDVFAYLEREFKLDFDKQ